MARILLGWELGGDYGHLMRFITLAGELRARGHECVFVLRELTHVDKVMHDQPYRILQAPIFLGQIVGLPPAVGFAETLLQLGFLSEHVLVGLCRAWRALVDILQPDLLVFDYAPTAMLATRNVRIPRVQFSSSFGIPPAAVPIPLYRWWKPELSHRVSTAEQIVLRFANKALARLGEPPMQTLAELLKADASILACVSELDQYPSRGPVTYWGDISNLASGVTPLWPMIGAKRVFAYLKPGFRDLARIMSALQQLDASVVAHIPGLSMKLTKAYTAANVSLSDSPVRMENARREADLVICHSGASTVESSLTAGKPLLLLPQHLEQMMTAKRVEELGAGLLVNPEKASPSYDRLLKRLLGEPHFTDAARSFAQKYKDDVPSLRVHAIVDALEQLLPPSKCTRLAAWG